MKPRMSGEDEDRRILIGCSSAFATACIITTFEAQLSVSSLSFSVAIAGIDLHRSQEVAFALLFFTAQLSTVASYVAAIASATFAVMAFEPAARNVIFGLRYYQIALASGLTCASLAILAALCYGIGILFFIQSYSSTFKLICYVAGSIWGSLLVLAVVCSTVVCFSAAYTVSRKGMRANIASPA